ncbi:hypothetical protein QBC36DRAFT_306766 [Triangularia setosa]|uniref:Uncharacterized protein n=1 Tax=Triangularia setosa TaxID=2587417 RepID=A0AAN6WGR3_9PEZI|nr:hypothetical protein QBC36DRAFT_306766 [Podospora setosa]
MRVSESMPNLLVAPRHHFSLLEPYSDADWDELMISLLPRSPGTHRVNTLTATSTWSPDTLKQIQQWLKTCASSHNQCANRGQPNSLLRRLMDVWSAADVKPDGFD